MTQESRIGSLFFCGDIVVCEDSTRGGLLVWTVKCGVEIQSSLTCRPPWRGKKVMRLISFKDPRASLVNTPLKRMLQCERAVTESYMPRAVTTLVARLETDPCRVTALTSPVYNVVWRWAKLIRSFFGSGFLTLPAQIAHSSPSTPAILQSVRLGCVGTASVDNERLVHCHGKVLVDVDAERTSNCSQAAVPSKNSVHYTLVI